MDNGGFPLPDMIVKTTWNKALHIYLYYETKIKLFWFIKLVLFRSEYIKWNIFSGEDKEQVLAITTPCLLYRKIYDLSFIGILVVTLLQIYVSWKIVFLHHSQKLIYLNE